MVRVRAMVCGPNRAAEGPIGPFLRAAGPHGGNFGPPGRFAGHPGRFWAILAHFKLGHFGDIPGHLRSRLRAVIFSQLPPRATDRPEVGIGIRSIPRCLNGSACLFRGAFLGSSKWSRGKEYHALRCHRSALRTLRLY